MAEDNVVLPPNTGNIQSVDIDSQMRTAYLDYAMSVIVARALPDARELRTGLAKQPRGGNFAAVPFAEVPGFGGKAAAQLKAFLEARSGS